MESTATVDLWKRSFWEYLGSFIRAWQNGRVLSGCGDVRTVDRLVLILGDSAGILTITFSRQVPPASPEARQMVGPLASQHAKRRWYRCYKKNGEQRTCGHHRSLATSDHVRFQFPDVFPDVRPVLAAASSLVLHGYRVTPASGSRFFMAVRELAIQAA